MVVYKIDRRGGGVQKSFTRTDPMFLTYFLILPTLIDFTQKRFSQR